MDKSIENRRGIPPAPIHPWAAVSTILLDNIFGVLEIVDPIAILLTSLTVFTINSVTTALVQRYLAKEGWGKAVAKGLVMGVFAGVPFPVTGTAIGLPLLGWAGLHEWVKPKPASKPEADEEVVDAEFRDITEK